MFPYNYSEDGDRLVLLGLSVRAYNYCLRNDIRTISSLLEYYKNNGNSIPPGINAGRTTINELERACIELIKNKTPITTHNRFSGISTWGISVRAYNYCQTLRLTTEEALIQYYIEHGESIPTAANAGRTTVEEITRLCHAILQEEKYKSVYEQLLSSASSSDITSRLCQILHLEEDDAKHLETFVEKHHHYPVLWLTSKYIDTDDDALCFATVYKVDSRRPSKTVSAISNELNVSVSRVGQRVTKGYQKIFGNPKACRIDNGRNKVLVSLLSLVDLSYLFELCRKEDSFFSNDSSSVFAEVNREELTGFSVAFILRYLSSFCDYIKSFGDFERNRANVDVITIKQELTSIVDFQKLFNKMDDIIATATDNLTFNVRDFVEDSPFWKQYQITEVNKVVAICKSYLLSKHGLYNEDDSENIPIIPLKIDLCNVVYNIIAKAGVPLTLYEICVQIKRQFPTKDIHEDSVKIALRDEKRIQYQRDSADGTKYLLAELDVPTSVRDAIVRVLDQSSAPVLLDDIVSYVLNYFPSSSKNSVRTTMLNDSKSRFVQYSGGRYGLVSKHYSDQYERLMDTGRVSYEERLIQYKSFLHDNHRPPYTGSEDESEVSLAKWAERNQSHEDLKSLVSGYAPIFWQQTCDECEKYIDSHHGKLPTKESEPRLYKWMLKAAGDYQADNLNQSQRKAFLHLKMKIKNRYA